MKRQKKSIVNDTGDTEEGALAMFVRAKTMLNASIEEFRVLQVRIGMQMKNLRESKCVTLRGLAQRVNYSASFLCDLEKGRRDWSMDHILMYEEALK